MKRRGIRDLDHRGNLDVPSIARGHLIRFPRFGFQGLAFFWSEEIEINNVNLQSSISTNIGAHSAGFLQIRVAFLFRDSTE